MVSRKSDATLVGGQQRTEMVLKSLNRVGKSRVVTSNESRWKTMTEYMTDTALRHSCTEFTQHHLRLSTNTAQLHTHFSLLTNLLLRPDRGAEQ